MQAVSDESIGIQILGDNGEVLKTIEKTPSLASGNVLYTDDSPEDNPNAVPSHLLIGGLFGWFAVPLKLLEEDPLPGIMTPTRDVIFVANEGLYEDFILSIHSDSEKQELEDRACATVSHPNSSSLSKIFYPTVTGDIIAHATCILNKERTTVWVLMPQ